MTTSIPSLVGYTPEEAEVIAAGLGLLVVWLDAPPPRWLSAHHTARVGRQRQRPDGTLELLRVLIPILPPPDTGEHAPVP